MNKRGQLGFGLFVLGSVILVATALFSISSFNSTVERTYKDFSNIHFSFEFQEDFVPNNLEQIVSQTLDRINLEGFDFDQSFETVLRDVASERRSSSIADNSVPKIIEMDYILVDNGSYYSLIVEDVLISKSKGFNEIRRVFDVEIRFNEHNVLSTSVQ